MNIDNERHVLHYIGSTCLPRPHFRGLTKSITRDYYSLFYKVRV